MATPVVLETTRDTPVGGHALSFHVDRVEARIHALDFLAGAPSGQPARYWVVDQETADYYAEAAGDRSPRHVGCVAILEGEQVAEDGGRLRPAAAVRQYLGEHPGGVTVAGETISHYWTADSVPAHLEYEAWFQGQAATDSRYLCPYDLASVPPGLAPRVMRELGASHSHVVLSESNEPGVRLLQLFVFDTVHHLPERLEATLDWAVRLGLVAVDETTGALTLTKEGDRLIRVWGERKPPAPARDRRHAPSDSGRARPTLETSVRP